MNAATWVVIAAIALRLILAGFTGLGIDESYMVAASNHFAASYFDHPLASWWLELAMRALTGTAAPIMVRLPFVVLSGVSSWLLYLITKRLYGEKAGFWAVVAYSISPVFSLAFGCWVLPDGPLNTALLAFLYAIIRALGLPEAKPAPRWWLAVGLFGGLALLSKYNAGLVLLGAALGVLADPVGRRELRRPGPWLAVLLACVLFTPVLAWNAAHHWVSFAYQGDRAAGLHLRPLMPLSIWGGEALYLLPWIFAPMVWLLAGALAGGPAERRGWLLGTSAIIPVVLFSVVGLWSSTRILYHWAMPGYLMLFPLLGDWATRIAPRPRNLVAAASATLLALAALFMAVTVSSGLAGRFARLSPPGKSPVLQAVDWTGLARQIPPHVQAIATLRWFDAGKIGYGLLRDGDHIPVTVFGGNAHEFGITAPPVAFIGKTVLLTAMPGDISKIRAKYTPYFKSLRPGPALTVSTGNKLLLVIPTLIGTDLQAPPRP